MSPRAKSLPALAKGGVSLSESTVAVGVVRALLELAVRKGADRAALATRSGIVANELEDPDARIPMERYIALMRNGQKLADDPALALHFAEEVNLSEISIVGLITHSCRTMGDAFAQIARYNRLVAEHGGPSEAGRFQRLPAPDDRHWLIDNRSNPNAFPEATEVAFARLVLGPRIFDKTPFCRAVHLTYPEPLHRGEYDRIFQAPIFFGSDKNALLIDNDWSHRAIAPKQRYAFGILCARADALLKNLENSKSLRSQIEAIVMPILHTGEVRMDSVASQLGLSQRTLLRRLRDLGVTYKGLIDDLRHRLAMGYLDGHKASINEIAYLVGFADPAAFSRAFKRWTGVSPGEARSRRGKGRHYATSE